VFEPASPITKYGIPGSDTNDTVLKEFTQMGKKEELDGSDLAQKPMEQ